MSPCYARQIRNIPKGDCAIARFLTHKLKWWYNKSALWIAKIHQNTTSGLMSCFFYVLKRLTGRLAVVIVSVKPFAKIMGCYLCQNRDNEFCYELQGIHLPPSWCLGDSLIIISWQVLQIEYALKTSQNGLYGLLSFLSRIINVYL